MATELRMTARAAKASSPSHEEMSDGDLLKRFADDQDDLAFETLLRRHGPLVMGVCRRILQHHQDTEDAFQATFLILARKARTIQQHKSLGSWLYKVAYRLALRVRTKKAKQKARESNLGPTTAPTYTENGKELNWLVDEEIQRLPEKYRLPVLMCYLQGQTNEEAAEKLKCPTGTVKVRLMRARELLKKRLVRRGISAAVGVVLTLWAQDAHAALPDFLVSETVEAAMPLGGGGSASQASGCSQGEMLARGWLRRMAQAKLKLAGSLLLVIFLVLGVDQMLQKAHSAPIPQFHTPQPPPVEKEQAIVPTFPQYQQTPSPTTEYEYLM